MPAKAEEINPPVLQTKNLIGILEDKVIGEHSSAAMQKAASESFSLRSLPGLLGIDMRKSDLYLFAAWILSLIASLTSLFFSEFMNLPPCNLCWYQRICMYPLVLVLGIGFSTRDERNHLYSYGLIVAGWLLAAYHNLLYYKIIPEKLAPCSAGASCTDKQLEVMGFLTIPLMSLIGFTVLFILILLSKKTRNHV